MSKSRNLAKFTSDNEPLSDGVLDKSDIGLSDVDNVSASDLRDRSTHTGTQALSTISDAGTIASQDADSVDIDGGNIDGTAIGANSADEGNFTTLDASGDVTIADKIVHAGDTNTAIRFPSADLVTFETAGNEAMRIDPSGHAIIPAGVTLGTAAGVYNAANTLDDYEEGTWTPAFSARSTDFTSVSYDTPNTTGFYTKIGNTVFFSGVIRTSSVTVGSATGQVTITGLPFSSPASSIRSVITLAESGRFGDWTTAPSSASIVQSDKVGLYKLLTLGSGDEELAPSDLDTGSNRNFLQFSGHYKVT